MRARTRTVLAALRAMRAAVRLGRRAAAPFPPPRAAAPPAAAARTQYAGAPAAVITSAQRAQRARVSTVRPYSARSVRAHVPRVPRVPPLPRTCRPCRPPARAPAPALPVRGRRRLPSAAAGEGFRRGRGDDQNAPSAHGADRLRATAWQSAVRKSRDCATTTRNNPFQRRKP